MDTLQSDRDEILHLLLSGKNPIPFLERNNPLCLYLRHVVDTIVSGENQTGIEYIGEGSNAKVYRISKGYINPRKSMDSFYAVKLLERPTHTSFLKPFQSLRQFASKNNLDLNLLEELNPIIAPDSPFHDMKTIIIGYLNSTCYLDKPQKYRIDKPPSIVTVPAGSIVCYDSNYTEALIGMLCANLYTTGKCFHFVNTLDLITCSEDKYQYIVMETIDSNVVNEKTYSADIFIQTAVAIAMFNQAFWMVHGDLTESNIFLIRNDGHIQWNNQTLQPNDILEYQIGETTLYLPPQKWLVKVGDFGFSVKYSTPIIGSEIVLDGYNIDNTGNILLPISYSGVYDFGMVLYIFFYRVGRANPWFIRVLAWFLSLPMDSTFEEVQDVSNIYFNPETARMRVDQIDNPMFDDKTAFDFLTHPVLTWLYQLRPAGTPVTMAIL